jgi:hypothetical protein
MRALTDSLAPPDGEAADESDPLLHERLKVLGYVE